MHMCARWRAGWRVWLESPDQGWHGIIPHLAITRFQLVGIIDTDVLWYPVSTSLA